MPILINDIPVESFKFPGGECHVNIREALLLHASLFCETRRCFTKIVIKAYLYNSDDLILLLLTVDSIRRSSIPLRITDLIIPYFPYARQDRICNEGEALSVKVIANIINSLKLKSVSIYDPHSDVTAALINNCHIINSLSLIENTALDSFIRENKLTFICPDQGSAKKVRQWAECFNRPMICATKIRDAKTGNIMKTEINLFLDSKSNVNQDFLIIDDICDGGNTFVEIIKNLTEIGICGNFYLYVTHGVFSKGLSPLLPYFKKIYCYHTFLLPDKIKKDYLEILERRY